MPITDRPSADEVACVRTSPRTLRDVVCAEEATLVESELVEEVDCDGVRREDVIIRFWKSLCLFLK